MKIFVLISASTICMFLLPYSHGCSFAPGYAVFEVDPQGFERKFDANGEYIAVLPAPTVTVDQITRGSAPSGASCADAGLISVTIQWPTHSRYSLGEIGFYFRAPLSDLPDLIFPLEPVAPLNSNVSGNTATFTFVWLDEHPDQQMKLNFELEVFAVNMGLEIGPPTRLQVRG